MSSEAVGIVSDGLNDIGLFLDNMNDVVAKMESDEDVVALRVELEETLSRVRGAIGAADSRLIQLIEPGKVVSGGGGEVVVEVKGKQITHGLKLAAQIAAYTADRSVDRQTGEVLPPAVLTEIAVNEMVECFGLHTPSTRISTTAIKARNMKPASFREFQDGTPKVRVL